MKSHPSKWFSVEEVHPVRGLYPILFLLVLVIGGLEYLSDFELSFSFFYIFAISITTWREGQKSGFLMAVFCAAIGLLVGLIVGHPNALRFVPYWEALNRFAMYYIVVVLLSRQKQALASERKLALTDALTGILNSRAFYHELSLELERVKRHPRPLTVLYMDVDNFKAVNDMHGHETGDRLLATVAHTLSAHIRTIDKVARLGGDEFALLLPETDETAARSIAARLRLHLLADMADEDWPATFSIGALTCHTPPEDVNAVIRQADQLMYEVKHASKDGIAYRVV